jgi:hypothetical protein
MNEPQNDSFTLATQTMGLIMEKEKQRLADIGIVATKNELLNYLAKQLETYEDENLKPISKSTTKYFSRTKVKK